MNAIRLALLSTVLLCWVPQAPAQDDLPPAAKEVLTEDKKFQSAVTIWSLSDGKVLQARWRPYKDGDIFKMLAWMTFLDDNRLRLYGRI